MVSKENKREAVLHDKLQLLRSITKSHAMDKSSIIVDASHYIKQLQNKVEILKKDVADLESSRNQNLWPEVTVEPLQKRFSVNVQYSRSTCPGLLVSILETCEDLGLNVLEARVSCAENFHLQALGEVSNLMNADIVFGMHNDEDEEIIDAQMVKRAISNSIKNWSETVKPVFAAPGAVKKTIQIPIKKRGVQDVLRGSDAPDVPERQFGNIIPKSDSLIKASGPSSISEKSNGY